MKLCRGSTLQVTYTWSFANGSPTFTIPNSAAKDLVVPASILSGSAVAGTVFTVKVAAALSVRAASTSHLLVLHHPNCGPACWRTCTQVPETCSF